MYNKDEENVEHNKTTETQSLEVLIKEEETSRVYMDSIKSGLTRIIKTYRLVKPEIKLAMCFSQYSGIVSSEGRAMKEHKKDKSKDKKNVLIKDKDKDKDKENNIVKEFLRSIVHAIMLFLSDIMPQPVSSMMKTMTEMWYTTRDMYKAMRRDEMGDCSMDYMSKRFWWWLGISK